ncbi:MAG: hypothetical protein A3K19_19135 [Lentisphaerae bacterium RIFOXYB12_FULL_65_16]|nr:MAG: hypothetical protein A3K18_23965 [Lentisphaerae bacterium RIFOXYA12_64_32]OGV91566.1 MAG: hypothetical protein A3K19_19135 [Lentisphaerae bacterium RIFOXYB12_FULL_65_16]
MRRCWHVGVALVLSCLVVGIAALAQDAEKPLALKYALGLATGADKSDGVVFRVELTDAAGARQVLAEETYREQAWQERSVDLSRWRNQDVVLRFTTAPGPTTSDDWACWGEPRVTLGDDVLVDFLKAKLWRTGIVVNGQETSPMPGESTGATFTPAADRDCGGVRKDAIFAHPPWRGDIQGGAAFGEFKVALRPGAESAQAALEALPLIPGRESVFPRGQAGCFRVAKPIVVDGKLDDWPAEVRKFSLSITQRDNLSIEVFGLKPGWKMGWQGPRDLSAEVYLAWDDANLYLAAIRRDDVLMFHDTTSADFARSDSLRVCISTQPGGSAFADTDYLIAVNPAGEQDKPMVKFCQYGDSPNRALPCTGVQVAPTLYKGGYILEVAIPFALLKVAPKAGVGLGFQLMFEDSDTPGDRHYEMVWTPRGENEDDYWQNPSRFGRLTLCERAYPWLELSRRIFAVGEALRPTLGVVSLDPGAKVNLEMELRTPQSDAATKWAHSGLAGGPCPDLPALESAGKSELVYSLGVGSDASGGALQVEVVADRPVRDIRPFSQPDEPTLLPSVAVADFRNSVSGKDGAFRFEYAGSDGTLRYTLKPGAGFDIAVAWNDREVCASKPDATGPVVWKDGKAVPAAACAVEVRDVKLENQELRFACSLDGRLEVAYRVAIRGKTLLVDVESAQPEFCEVRNPFGALQGEEPFIPYLDGRMQPVFVNGCYVTCWFDWATTGCSSLGKNTSYGEKTDGTRNPLRERVCVTASPELLETLHNLPNPTSRFFDVLAPRMMLDWWGWPGSYVAGARYLRELKGYGVEQMVIIYHVWQNMGYDNGLPLHVPAMESMGGDAGMKVLGATAKELGYPFSLHENYIDYYPNYPQYTEDAIAVDGKGRKFEAWFHPGNKIQSYRLKPSWIEKYVRDQAPQIHERYQTTAAYLDVHTIGIPWQTDFDAKAGGAASFAYAYERMKWLFRYEQDTHGGPLFGEGNRHSVWAGIVDGCEAQVGARGGQLAPVLPDFDLLKVHPLCVNHGMGYYERWLGDRHGKLTDSALDQYRNHELAYGHAVFVGTALMPNLTQVLREYYVGQPLQARYAPAKPVTVEYLFDDRWVSSQVACRTEAPRKIHVAYDNGFELWLNDEREGWQVEGRTLPAYGFVAKGAGVEACTALFGNGQVGDCVDTAERLFVDPRNEEVSYRDPEKDTAAQLEPLPPQVEFQPGTRTFKISYQWRVVQAPVKDYTVFVHFTDADGGAILWQNDHRPEPPTSSWAAGATVTTGPFDVEIPGTVGPGTYDIRVGMFRPGESRLRMNGSDDGGTRYVIGRIVLAQAGEQTTLAFASAPAAAAQKPGRNPAGARLDFGAVETDVTLRIDKLPDALLLLPIPHGAKGCALLRPDRFGRIVPGAAAEVTILDKDMKPLATAAAARAGNDIVVLLDNPDAWFYRIALPPGVR